jgi:hypothetical protein
VQEKKELSQTLQRDPSHTNQGWATRRPILRCSEEISSGKTAGAVRSDGPSSRKTRLIVATRDAWRAVLASTLAFRPGLLFNPCWRRLCQRRNHNRMQVYGVPRQFSKSILPAFLRASKRKPAGNCTNLLLTFPVALAQECRKFLLCSVLENPRNISLGLPVPGQRLVFSRQLGAFFLSEDFPDISFVRHA